MKNYFSLMLLLSAALFTGCSQDDIADGNEKPTDGVTMSVKDFVSDNQTRTSLTLDESTGLKFSWSEGDDVCVFGSNDKQQVRLTMVGGADVNRATFTSGDYTLAKGNTFVAYYPYIDKVSQEPMIPVSYEGQTQTANNDYAHLSKYDFIVSDKVVPESDNNVHFDFNHMGAILRLKIEMPEAGTWQSVTLSATDEAFTTAATLDLFGETLIKPTTTSSSVTLNLNNIETTEANEVLTAWFMLSPADFTSRAMTVTVKSANGGEDVVYQLSPNKNFEAGKAYSFTLKSGVQYVDLGLPSGTLWADRNVGAEKITDYGNYFGWGDPTGTVTSQDGNDYLYFGQNGTLDTSTGYYCWIGNIVGTQYDAATAMLGDEWQLPTSNQIDELLENTTHGEQTVDGVECYVFKSKSNNKELVVPLAGYRLGTSVKLTGSYFYFWSGECWYYPNGQKYVERGVACSNYDSSHQSTTADYDFFNKAYGFSIRAVRK